MMILAFLKVGYNVSSLEETIQDFTNSTKRISSKDPEISGTEKTNLEGQDNGPLTTSPVGVQCEGTILQFNQILNPTKKVLTIELFHAQRSNVTVFHLFSIYKITF